MFTMDDERNKAVTEAFVQLHERGMIFRGRRMVNWCVALNTAISDIEVEQQELDGRTTISVPMDGEIDGIAVDFGVMYDIAYPLDNSMMGTTPPGELVVSTTRPETIPCDVALAVHPEDERYRYLLKPGAPSPLHPSPLHPTPLHPNPQQHRPQSHLLRRCCTLHLAGRSIPAQICGAIRDAPSGCAAV